MEPIAEPLFASDLFLIVMMNGRTSSSRMTWDEMLALSETSGTIDCAATKPECRRLHRKKIRKSVRAGAEIMLPTSFHGSIGCLIRRILLSHPAPFQDGCFR